MKTDHMYTYVGLNCNTVTRHNPSQVLRTDCNLKRHLAWGWEKQHTYSHWINCLSILNIINILYVTLPVFSYIMVLHVTTTVLWCLQPSLFIIPIITSVQSQKVNINQIRVVEHCREIELKEQLLFFTKFYLILIVFSHYSYLLKYNCIYQLKKKFARLLPRQAVILHSADPPLWPFVFGHTISCDYFWHFRFIHFQFYFVKKLYMIWLHSWFTASLITCVYSFVTFCCSTAAVSLGLRKDFCVYSVRTTDRSDCWNCKYETQATINQNWKNYNCWVFGHFETPLWTQR